MMRGTMDATATEGLTKRYGDSVKVDRTSLKIGEDEFLGPLINGIVGGH